MNRGAFYGILTERRRHLILAAVIILGIFILDLSEQAPDPAPLFPAEKTIATAGRSEQPVMPKGYQAQAAVRDPFAVPAGLRPVPNTNSARAVDMAGQNPVSQMPAPELQGIVTGTDNAAAILQTGAASRSYLAGEYAGAYQILTIRKDAVVLVGPNGNLVLTMRR